MKAYGIPREAYLKYPDLGDIYKYGLPGHLGNLPGRGGDIRSLFRSSTVKKQIRRMYKRRARLEGKMVCQHEE